jgi:hypothetical protein
MEKAPTTAAASAATTRSEWASAAYSSLTLENEIDCVMGTASNAPDLFRTERKPIARVPSAMAPAYPTISGATI